MKETQFQIMSAFSSGRGVSCFRGLWVVFSSWACFVLGWGRFLMGLVYLVFGEELISTVIIFTFYGFL